MSKTTLYNYVKNTYTQITDEVYTNVGTSFTLGDVKRAFLESSFQIEDADSGGNVLQIGIDYELDEKDTYYTTEEGANVYTKINILNSAYETGSLYITYRLLLSYVDADFFNTMRIDVDTNTSAISSLQSNPVLPYGYITGLTISNGIDADHDINIATGRTKDSTGVTDIVLSSGLTKQLDAAWSVGTNAGGLDTGSIAADTWYYLFAILKDSDSSVDILFSISPTSPTMPAGYTYFRRIRGAILTDGSANIIQFRQKDNDFRFSKMIQDVSDLSTSTSRTVAAVSVPPDFMGNFTFHAFAGAASYHIMQEVADIDTAPAYSTYYDIEGSNHGAMRKQLRVNSSSQIAYRASLLNSDTFIFTEGFLDNAEL